MQLEHKKKLAIEKDDFDGASLITSEIYKLKDMVAENQYETVQDSPKEVKKEIETRETDY